MRISCLAVQTSLASGCRLPAPIARSWNVSFVDARVQGSSLIIIPVLQWDAARIEFAFIVNDQFLALVTNDYLDQLTPDSQD